MTFPFFAQAGWSDCSLACLKMVAAYFEIELRNVENALRVQPRGVSLFELSNAATAIGLANCPVKMTAEYFIEQAPFPCILMVGGVHFIVVPPQSRDHLTNTVEIMDPSQGPTSLHWTDFTAYWLGKDAFGLGIIFGDYD